MISVSHQPNPLRLLTRADNAGLLRLQPKGRGPDLALVPDRPQVGIPEGTCPSCRDTYAGTADEVDGPSRTFSEFKSSLMPTFGRPSLPSARPASFMLG
jgi:hypothetical protein